MALLSRANQRWVFPAAIALFAALCFLPQLGSYGLWDPQEITVGDQARTMARSGSMAQLYKSQPPLTVWMVATSTKIFGPSEFAARLPLALVGMLGALATYALGARLQHRRAGFIAAMVLLASPLYVFQARLLTSEVATITFQAVAMFGLVGLLCGGRTWVNAPIAVIGLVLAHLSDGLFLGAWIPLAAAAVGALATLWQEDRRPRAAIALGGAALLCLGWVAVAAFDIVTAQPGQLGLFGKTISAAKQYVPLLGGQLRQGPAPVTATFDTVINQVAFGMFPWSALAPIAVLRLARVNGVNSRPAWSGILVLAWASIAYLAATLWVRGVGDLRFPALASIAIPIGMFVDDLLSDDDREGMPLAALFVLLASVILILDLRNFPDELASVHLAGRPVKSPPEMIPFLYGILVLGAAWALATATGLYVSNETSGRRRIGRMALWAAVGAGAAHGLYCAQVYTPALSQHFSYKNLFESYFDHRRGDEPLAVMGIPGTGPEFYARGTLTRLDGVPQLLDFLNRPERVFAIAPADRMCQLHQNSRVRKLGYHVLDTRNARFLLLTNRLLDGEKDDNPLVPLFPKELPGSFSRPVTANFEDTIELLGADMPERVSHGSKFKMTLWFRVKKRPSQNYKILAHFDGFGVRFQGDHDPVGGKCGTTFWEPGDIVKDTYEVKAGELTNPKGTYTVHVGFWTGGAGMWKNMKVLSEPRGADDRVPLGPLIVE